MKSLKEFRSQINEVLKASDPIEKWIDDFVHSKNPKFAGKSTKERIEMAKGAYYGAQKNESAAISQNTKVNPVMHEDHLVHVSDGSGYDDTPHPKDIEHIKTGAMHTGGQWHGHSDKGAFFKFKSKEDAEHFKRHVDKCPHKSCYADHVNEAVEYKGIGTDVVDKKKVLNPPIPLTQKKKEVKDFKEEAEELDEGDSGLAAKAKKSGVSLSTLKTVYKRGVAAWNSGHRPGTTPQQWGMARVNSYITKGKGTYGGADKDLHEDARLDKKEYYKGMSDSTAKARVAHWKKADKMSDSNPKAYEPAPGDKTAKTTPSVHTKKYHAMYGEGYAHGPIDRDAKVGMGHKAAVLAGSGLDSGKHGTVVGSSKERTGDMWHIKTASGDIVKMHKHRVAKLKEETVEEAKVYDPITKKMVATKPIKVQAGGGATRNGVPVETGPSKYKQGLKEEQIDELSKTTLQSYRDKAAKDVGRAYAIHKDPYKKTDKDDMRKLSNRVKGDERAEIGLKKEDVQIDEVSKSTLVSYIDKASQDVHDKAMAAGSHHAGKSYKDFMANYAKSGKRQAGITKAAVKLAKEETVDEAIAKKLPVQHAVNAVHKTLGSKAATRFLGHLKPGTEKHTSWDKVNSALMKQGVQTKHIASIAQKTSHENVEESRGHKVLATFFKNREVAQRAFTGQNDKEKQPTYNEKDIETPKKEVKKESVNPALMAILKKRQEAQKKKEEDKKKVNEAMTPAVHAAEPKRTKSTSKQYASASIPGTKRVSGSKSDNNEPGEQIKEDQYTADYKIKYYVDPVTGENKTRKIRPHRVNFANSKMRGEPAQQDAQGDYGMKEGYVAEGGFDNYHEIAKELIKRHGKNVDTGHINDIAGERDTHRGLDHSEVMHHVNKILNKDVKEGEEYDEMWKEYKGKSFKKEQRMLNFNDYLKEAHLSAKQKKIAAIAGDKDKIDADDLAALRAGKKPVEEAKKCMDEDDMDESGLRMAAHAAHKAGKKEFEFQGKTYPVKVQKEGVLKPELEKGFPARGVKTGASAPKGTTYMPKKDVKEEVEQIDELSKKTLGSYVNKAAKDSRIHGQIATDFENTADKARKQSKRDSFERLNRKYLEKAWKREDGIKKAVDKLTKEDVQLDEGKMKELAMDLKDMSHDEFHKQYGKPKSHFDPTSFKKPVEPGKEMDRARALAQRGMKSVSEQLEEATTRKDFQMVADLIKGHESAEKRKELATHHAEIFKKQNPRFDHAKFMKAAGVNEETDSEYLKATLAFMDESKYDDYKDALRAKKATQSAFDKDFKPDTTHPHIQVVKGTQYGGENQKDDEGDEKPEADLSLIHI